MFIITSPHQPIITSILFRSQQHQCTSFLSIYVILDQHFFKLCIFRAGIKITRLGFKEIMYS